MSVINKVLNELDKRESSSRYGKYKAPEKNSRVSLLLIVTTICMFAVAGGIFAYRYAWLANKDKEVAKNYPISENQDKSINANSADISQNTSLENTNQQVADNLAIEQNKLKTAVIEENKPKENIISSQVAKVDDGKISEVSINKDIKKENQKEKITPDADNQDAYAEENFYVEEVPLEETIQESKKSYIKVTEKKLTGKEEIALERKQAIIALSKGDKASAIEAYRSILAKSPRDVNAREKLASLYYASNQTIEAVKVLDRGLELTPEHYDYRLYLSRIYASENQNSQAVKVLVMGNPPVKQNVDYYATLATLARNIGDNSTAESAYRRLTSVSGKDGKWFMGLGLVLEKQNKFLEARNAYQKANSLYLSVASKNFVAQRLKRLESISNDRK